MHYYKAFGLNIQSETDLPELSTGNINVNCDVVIKKAEFVVPTTTKTNIFRRGIKAEFAQDNADNLYLHWDGIASYKAVEGNVLYFTPLTPDNNKLSLFTVSEALGLILFQRKHFLLHASSVLVGNEAWCFMGAPGAGKSTTAAAFLKAGCQLLSDDLTAIMFTNGEPYIVPAYPQLKIWDNTVRGLNYDRTGLQPVSEGVNKFAYQPKKSFSHEKVRLRKIIFLHKDESIAGMRALNAKEIPTNMLENFPLPLGLLEGEALKLHFTQCFQCAAHAETWHLRRPEGFGNLEAWVDEAITGANISR
jgi:hypothetical protein